MVIRTEPSLNQGVAPNSRHSNVRKSKPGSTERMRTKEETEINDSRSRSLYAEDAILIEEDEMSQSFNNEEVPSTLPDVASGAEELQHGDLEKNLPKKKVKESFR